MRITKFGHSCLLVEEGELRALIDPGIYASEQNTLTKINAVFITHEHPDHCDPNSLKEILKNNPSAKVYSNESVAALLMKEGMRAHAVKNGDRFSEQGIAIEVFGDAHAVLHSSIPQVKNVGYFIANTLFHTGDQLTNPQKPIRVLSFPIVAPWAKLQETIDYVISLKPKTAFAVHDGMLLPNFRGPHRVTMQVLQSQGIECLIPEIGKPYEF